MHMPNIAYRKTLIIQEIVKFYAKIKILCILVRLHYIFKMDAPTGCYENFIY